MTASRNGHPQAADRLLVGGANVDLKDNVNQLHVYHLLTVFYCVHAFRLHIVTTWTSPFTQDGWTALMAASQNGSLKVVERLLEENADPNLPDNLVRQSHCVFMLLYMQLGNNIEVMYHCNYCIVCVT